jgi:hypothetical protein
MAAGALVVAMTFFMRILSLSKWWLYSISICPKGQPLTIRSARAPPSVVSMALAPLWKG